jgi:hypothetical protein
MPGGVIQLISCGVHDIYLIGCPQITYFKKVYKKHTHFAMESIEQEINGGTEFGRYVSAPLYRDGDLLSKLMLEMKFRATTDETIDLSGVLSVTDGSTTIDYSGNFYIDSGTSHIRFDASGYNVTLGVGGSPIVNNGGIVHSLLPSFSPMSTLNAGIPRIGTKAIDYIELTIGSQLIDRLYGEWIDIWFQLSSNFEKWTHLENMLTGVTVNPDGTATTYTPIPFWFTKNNGLALPMISLQYHEVKCNIQFKENIFNWTTDIDLTGYADTTDGFPFSSIVSITVFDVPYSLQMTDGRLFGDYIFLDTDERRMFASLNQEYLIEQLQFSNKFLLSPSININEIHFNHPVKELYWFYQLSNNNNTFNYWDNSGNDIMNECRLEYNGIERFKMRNNHYFRMVQSYYHHSGAFKQDASGEYGGFYTYSFGLNPELYQPSGTCNFSRINNAILYSDVKQTCSMNIYALNYNVLRIMNGMAGLMYGN